MNKTKGIVGLLAGGIFAALVPSAVIADGAALFEDYCSACHNVSGTGNPGLAPPLNLAEFWQGLGPRASEYLVGVMIGGMTGRLSAGGVEYIGLAMPAQDYLSDDEAAEIASWILAELGKMEAAVTPADIAATRRSPPAHAHLRKIRKGE